MNQFAEIKYWLLGGVVAAVSLVGCNDDITRDICNGKYERTFADAAAAIQPWMPDRKIASDPDSNAPPLNDVPDDYVDRSNPLAASLAGSLAGRPALVNNNHMAKEDRESWQDWAHSNLVSLQRLLDEVNALPVPTNKQGAQKIQNLKTEISGAAIELVQIDGLIELGKIENVVAALDRLHLRAEHARGLVCASD